MFLRPIAGSKTDLRGRKAKSHICREILELCTVIHDVGTYNTKKRDPDDDDQSMDDDTIIVSFGELFQVSTAANIYYIVQYRGRCQSLPRRTQSIRDLFLFTKFIFLHVPLPVSRCNLFNIILLSDQTNAQYCIG